MPLVDGQVQVRDLVMGPGTPFVVEPGFDPWSVVVDAGQGGARAWAHGGWSGAEWAAAVEVPVPVSIVANGDVSWQDARDELSAAFSPVGDAVEATELRWVVGGREYVRFGRPRGAATTRAVPENGSSTVRALFMALDQRIYSANETVQTFGLPTFVGGLTVPFTVPFTVDAVAVDGQADLVNEGTAEVGLSLRIDGPVIQPWLTLQRPDGVVQTLRFRFSLTAGQWVEVDTEARTVFLNGLPQASRRGEVAGDFPVLPPGVSTLLFRAAEESATAQVTATYRSAWW